MCRGFSSYHPLSYLTNGCVFDGKAPLRPAPSSPQPTCHQGFGKRLRGRWSAGAKGIHIPIVKTGHEAGERVLSVLPPAGRRSLPIYYGFITLHALSSGSRSRPSRSSGEAHKVTEAICEICSKIVKFARDLVGRAQVFQLYLASPLPGTTYRIRSQV